MSHLPIPLAVLYAGLGGTVIALIVATATNNWSPRVFVLLALRLAIGWHFLFEGLYKVNSHAVGVTDANPRGGFSSKPYFDVAPGPLGAQMRKGFVDTEAEIAAKVRAPKQISASEFAAKTAEEQADECTPAVAALFGDIKGDLERLRGLVDKTEEEETKAAERDKLEEAKARAKEKAEKARKAIEEKIKALEADATKPLLIAAKAKYARWVYGVPADARPASVKFISGDLALTAPQRLEHLDWAKRIAKEAEDRQAFALGKGDGTDQKRAAELRAGAQAAETDLVKDANAFIDELKKDFGIELGKAYEYTPDLKVKPESTRGQRMDKFTMWFLVVVGAMLMGGLFTRVACILAAGFLAMTYLAHPAFPWYPLPPNTEGNPLFINKNVIEALALLALATFPTGRWLGLDALVLRPLCKYKPEEHL